MNTMRILVIDDHKLFNDGITELLQRLSMPVETEQAHRATEALKGLIEGKRYDLILLDLNMPDMDGVSFFTALKQHSIVVPVAVISATEDISKIQNVLSMGAFGFISKSSDGDELLTAIETMLQGNVYTPPWLSAEYINANGQDTTLVKAKLLGITRRQYEVLKLMAHGNSNKQISDILLLTEATVKSHISALFQIFASSNRTECLNAAQRRGIINIAE
jgi:DNA-binding NarL/FixJ family response regulator